MSESGPPYPADSVDEDLDDGTMPANVHTLSEHIVGSKIVSAKRGNFAVESKWSGSMVKEHGLLLTLDNGVRVLLADSSDCCAYTELESFLLHPERVDHMITGVATTEGYTKWHIYADMGDILELEVGWSPGNPFYYGYGFDIHVMPASGAEAAK